MLQISRTTEVISTGLSFARSLGCDESKTTLEFGFRWTGLRGRRLASWVEPNRFFRPSNVAHQASITTTVAVPLETPPGGLAPHVENVVREVFALFDGMEIAGTVIEQIVTGTLQRHY